MTKLIVALDVQAGQYYEAQRARGSIPMAAVNPTPIDWDIGGQHRLNQIWAVDDKYVQYAVEEISKWHPGVDIGVYELTDIFFRPAGEMGHKQVTKDGILPT